MTFSRALAACDTGAGGAPEADPRAGWFSLSRVVSSLAARTRRGTGVFSVGRVAVPPQQRPSRPAVNLNEERRT